jgi:5,10-methylene-tetrahydrofolate dehydrogenase/methenyl tetrahydrofolate cyclohydrolase
MSTNEPLLLAGSPVAAERRAAVQADVETFRRNRGYAPALAVVLVGRNAPSAVYLHQIIKGTTKVGIDGLHPLNAGLLALGYDGFVPATAKAAVELLKAYAIDVDGLNAVVVGRSNIVGKPVARLLLGEHATVSTAHTHTRDLPGLVRTADLVVVAAGVPGLIKGPMLKPGAVVVDIGINVVGDKIVGDVEYDSACQVVSAITPVPGGVGPLTNAILLGQLMHAARGTGPALQVHQALQRMAGA